MAGAFIELGLLSREQPAGLIDRLLFVLSEAAVEAESLKTQEFRSRLEGYRQRLAAAHGKPDFARYSTECLRLCENYFERSKKHHSERESEVAEVIQFLRDAIGRLSGEASSFTTELTQTSERIERLNDLEDIRELKKQIAREVHQLKRVVEEKKKKDQAMYSRLTRRVELLRHSLEESRTEASQDALTGVANRRTFDKTLQEWLHRAQASKQPFVLAILDLDNFKSINDTRGHQVGDRVLLCAARVFSKSVRPSDFVGRFGGEEFVVLLDGMNTEQAHGKFTEILERLASTHYDYDVDGRPETISFTASCGLAEFGPGENADSLLRRADEALYQAKHSGKNRAVAAPGPKKSGGFWQSLRGA